MTEWPNISASKPTTTERMFKYILPEPNSGCWLWAGALTSHGYGEMHFERRTRLAHKILYELLVGAVPPGLELDHKCRVPSCVNPGHLEPVTHRENILRGLSPAQIKARNSAITCCPQGHKMDEAK